MIVKFLAKSKTFKGVRYNTNKVDKNKGELMKASGFGPLEGISGLKPQDYINYLNMVSRRSGRTKYPQLHAVISAKGKETSKEELTSIASAWLSKMGYGKQPYLVIFHKDTRNNHVHIVTTRVDKHSGKKINSAFEKIRAMIAIHQVIKQDECLLAEKDLQRALEFNFSTKAQFMMILEGRGYTVLEDQDKLVLTKFGRKLCEIDLSEITGREADYQPPEGRAKQITAFLYEYRLICSGVLRLKTLPLPGGAEQQKAGYTSDLAIALKEKFGIELIFHGKPGKPAYGYTVLDHAQGNAFKGNELMNIRVLTEDLGVGLESAEPIRSELSSNVPYQPHELVQGAMPLAFNGSFSPQQSFIPYEVPVEISISDDVDDEVIHGRNRRRKRQARTNTR